MIEVQPGQTNGMERVKRFVNVYLHCIVSNLKRISKLWTLLPLEKFPRRPMVHTGSIYVNANSFIQISANRKASLKFWWN